MNYRDGTLYYMGKERSALNSFYPVQKFFYKTLENGYDEIVREHKECFIQGFEWYETIDIMHTDVIDDLIVDDCTMQKKKMPNPKRGIKNLLAKWLR